MHLAHKGYEVYALGRNSEALAEMRKEKGVTTTEVDLTDTDAVEQMLGSFEVDILINNAGMMPPLGAFQNADPRDIERAIAVNFVAQVALTRLLVPGMCRRGGGQACCYVCRRHGRSARACG